MKANAIAAPARMRAARALLLLALPLAALETCLAARLPYWRVPPALLASRVGLASVILLPLFWALGRLRWEAFFAIGAAAVAWVATSGWMAVRMRNAGLGFFTVFLALFLGLALLALFIEMRRSFIDPMLKWFVGIPPVIPALRCHLKTKQADVAEALRVSRLDREGMFVVSEGSGSELAAALRLNEPVGFELRFRDRTLKCVGKAVRVVSRPESESCLVGIQFAGLTPDMSKELGDFVESLRGEGYVE